MIVIILMGAISQAQDEYTEFNSAYETTPTVESPRQGNWHGVVGGAVIGFQGPVADSRAHLLPLVAVSYRDTFFWHFGQVGAYVLNSNDRRARLAVALKARRGYKPSDNDELAGMDKRDNSLEAGINAVWRNRIANLRFGYFTDISGKSHGDTAQLNLSHPFVLAPRWILTPSIGTEWVSGNMVDYYYGVKTGESTITRPAYEGEASINLRAGAMVLHRLTRKWLLFGGASYTRLGSGISDSPIVIHDNVAALHFGAAWIF